MSVPDWAHYKGMNDRFAALGPLSAAIWKERLMFTMQKCREKPLHSEAFTFDFAMENNLQVCPRGSSGTVGLRACLVSATLLGISQSNVSIAEVVAAPGLPKPRAAVEHAARQESWLLSRGYFDGAG